MTSKKFLTVLKSYFFITLGLAISAFGWTAFLIPSKIIGGGVTGVSTLLYYYIGLPVGIWYLIINVFLVLIGTKHLGKKFALNTIFGILMNTTLFMILQPVFKTALVSDQFMAALIGGGLAGAGLGIAFANGGNSGGTDIIALIVSKYRNISPGRIILYLDIVIIASSYVVFHSVEKIVYGYVVMAVASYTLDLVLQGEKQSFQIFVFSKKSQQITDRILKDIGRGVTIFKAYGGYTKKPIDVLMVIGRKYDKMQIMKLIKETDNQAFISISKVQAVFGQNFEELKI